MTVNASQVSKRSRHVPWLVVGITLLVLVSAIYLITRYLRSALRAQIIQQDGIALYAASIVPASDIKEDDEDIRFDELRLQVMEAALSRDEVMGVRVFNSEGVVDFGESDGELTRSQLNRLMNSQAISSFEPNAKLSDIGVPIADPTDPSNTEPVPILRVLVPLEIDEVFMGAAEFILDGQKVARSLADLDRDLWLYGGLIFILGGGIVSIALLWAFRRLQTANALLEERTKSLLRANHELTMSAKTSAIGAITAHLIHDLKSPLFGLQSFVSARGSADDEDWDIALDTTQRMQKVIQEIVRILQEEKTTEKYELSFDELFSLLRVKLGPVCEKAGLRLRLECTLNGFFANRDANIILLTVSNVAQNAIQATPRGGEISVTVYISNSNICFEMRDTGPGLPPHIQRTLFLPSRSTKTDGTGLGLAISKQLANHIGAELSLKETSSSGTVFELRVPERVLVSQLAIS